MSVFEEGIKAYQNTPGSLLVDLRDPEDYEKGHIPGAIQCALGALRDEIRRIATFRTPIFLYCYVGMRSLQAEEMLRAKGYAGARSIGGLEGYTGEITHREMTIRQLREENHLTQTALAEVLGVSPAAVGHYETGRAVPGKAVSAKILAIYNVVILPEARLEVKTEAKTDSRPEAGPEAAPKGRGGRPARQVSETGMAIQALRKSLGMSQAAFAATIGVSHAAVGHYENGIMTPSAKVVDKLREVYGPDWDHPAPKPEQTAEQPVEKPAEKPARKKPGRKPKAPKPEQTAVEPVEKPAPTPTLILQAPDGREVTLSDLRDRLQGLGTVYVRPDEGRAYWVRGMETGSVALW